MYVYLFAEYYVLYYFFNGRFHVCTLQSFEGSFIGHDTSAYLVCYESFFPCTCIKLNNVWWQFWVFSLPILFGKYLQGFISENQCI